MSTCSPVTQASQQLEHAQMHQQPPVVVSARLIRELPGWPAEGHSQPPPKKSRLHYVIQFDEPNSGETGLCPSASRLLPVAKTGRKTSAKLA